jgi:hypothetical protein
MVLAPEAGHDNDDEVELEFVAGVLGLVGTASSSLATGWLWPWGAGTPFLIGRFGKDKVWRNASRV